jgi:hypothetical protein
MSEIDGVQVDVIFQRITLAEAGEAAKTTPAMAIPIQKRNHFRLFISIPPPCVCGSWQFAPV